VEVEKISSSNLVVKGNDLIISRYNLSLAEQRLILQVVSMINKDDEDFKDYYVKVNDYIELLGIKSPNCYLEIKKFAEELLKKPLYIPQNDGKDFFVCNWFSSLKYKSGSGVLICRFDPNLTPYLLQLKNRFTAYRLENVLKLKSKYSIRLYEVLKRYENIRETKIPIDNFRKYLAIPKTYKYNDIRKQILQPSQEEFKKYTDIIFEYYEIKEGRKVAGLKFVIYQNEKNIIDTNHVVNPSQQNSLDQYRDNKYLHEESINTLNDDLKVLMNAVPEEERIPSLEAYLSKCLKNYDARYLLYQIKYVSQQKPKSFFAYLKKAIEEDYAKSKLIEEQEKAEKARIENVIKRRLEKLEKEKEHTIDRLVGIEKIKIYEEYIELLEEIKKQELFKEYKEKTKELHPDVEEKSFFFEELMKSLITEDIITKNEIYQIRLEKARITAQERAEREYNSEKEKLDYEIKNGLL